MRKIYSHPDLGIVHLLKNELENRGILASIRGEHGAAMIGAATGIDAWTELWIADDDRVVEAVRIVQMQTDDGEAPGGEPWTCPSCGETLEAQFGACWNCGEARP